MYGQAAGAARRGDKQTNAFLSEHSHDIAFTMSFSLTRTFVSAAVAAVATVAAAAVVVATPAVHDVKLPPVGLRHAQNPTVASTSTARSVQPPWLKIYQVRGHPPLDRSPPACTRLAMQGEHPLDGL